MPHDRFVYEVGSILGVWIPICAGGAAQLFAGYPGNVSAFVARPSERADKHGSRFAPPELLGERDLVAARA
jgi:3-hydroxyacyl-CoA dehydrogenase/enoyl-CoA hydratase/3-hydroxybutyryl-CoA epimerase